MAQLFWNRIKRWLPGKSSSQIQRPDVVFKPDAASIQLTSPFFRLPLEIREQIYESFFGTTRVHFFNFGGKLRSFACHNEPSDKCQWDCISLPPIKKHGDDPTTGILALPLTCRRIYSESLNLMYTSSIFHVFDPDLRYNDISQFYHPDRWHAIRNIHLSLKMHSAPLTFAYRRGYTPTEASQSILGEHRLYKTDLAWIATFKNLTALSGLQEVIVEIVLSQFWSSSWIHDGGLIFWPLLTYVVGPQSLVLRCGASVLPKGPYTKALDCDDAREMSRAGLSLMVEEWQREHCAVELDGEMIRWIRR